MKNLPISGSRGHSSAVRTSPYLPKCSLPSSILEIFANSCVVPPSTSRVGAPSPTENPGSALAVPSELALRVKNENIVVS